MRASVPVAGPPLVAAVIGNAFIGRSSLAWFNALRRPGMQVPLPVFVVVGGVYYGLMGVVLQRAQSGQDTVLRNRTYAVLAGNELWNVLLFGRRSTRAGFVGMLAFAPAVLALQHRAQRDRWARVAAGVYTAWVLGYDVPWSYRLWRLNP